MDLVWLLSLTPSLQETPTVSKHLFLFTIIQVVFANIFRFLTVLSLVLIPAMTSPPGTPEITAVGREHVIIEWMKPENDGGSEIKNYIVERREKSSVRWTRVNRTFTIYDTRLKISGLMEGSEYQFRVTAENAAGPSLPSDACPYVLCKDPTCKFQLKLLMCFINMQIFDAHRFSIHLYAIE